jgi:hypothetical protein
MMGHSVRRLSVADRLCYGAAGLCLLIPLEALELGRWINIAGAAVAGALFLWERSRRVAAGPVRN